MAIALDSRPDVEPVREPGGFARHPHNGAPYVNHPTEVTKQGKPKRVMYGRPSSLGKIIEDATNLQKWSERAVALGLYLDFAAAAQRADVPTLFEQLDNLTDEQLNLDDADARVLLDSAATIAKRLARTGLAADRGTHHHALTEDHDEDRDWVTRAAAGVDLGVPVEAQAALVAAWNQFLDVHGFEILTVEMSVVDDRWRQAGTLDRIARLTKPLQFVMAGGEIVELPTGWVGVLDVKTGKLRTDRSGHPDYWHGYAVQIASYAQSVPYDTEIDARGEWPWDIDQRWGVIAHLDVLAALDGAAVCRPVLVDLEAGRAAGDLCIAAKQWGKRRDVFSLVTGDGDVVVPVEVASQSQPAELTDGAMRAAPSVEFAGEAVPVRPLAASPATDPDAERAALRERQQELRAVARRAGWLDRFDAEWAAAGITPASTNAEISAALDAILEPFDPEPAAPEPAPAPAMPAIPLVAERDQPADQADVDALVNLIGQSPQKDVVNGWLMAAHNAGRSWSPRTAATQRNVAVCRAAWLLAEACDGEDEYVHLLLDQVNAPAAPGLLVAERIAMLTLDEARRLAEITEAFTAGQLGLRFTADGAPYLEAAA